MAVRRQVEIPGDALDRLRESPRTGVARISETPGSTFDDEADAGGTARPRIEVQGAKGISWDALDAISRTPKRLVATILLLIADLRRQEGMRSTLLLKAKRLMSSMGESLRDGGSGSDGQEGWAAPVS